MGHPGNPRICARARKDVPLRGGASRVELHWDYNLELDSVLVLLASLRDAVALSAGDSLHRRYFGEIFEKIFW